MGIISITHESHYTTSSRCKTWLSSDGHLILCHTEGLYHKACQARTITILMCSLAICKMHWGSWSKVRSKWWWCRGRIRRPWWNATDAATAVSGMSQGQNTRGTSGSSKWCMWRHSRGGSQVGWKPLAKEGWCSYWLQRDIVSNITHESYNVAKPDLPA